LKPRICFSAIRSTASGVLANAFVIAFSAPPQDDRADLSGECPERLDQVPLMILSFHPASSRQAQYRSVFTRPFAAMLQFIFPDRAYIQPAILAKM
jgi:hypothetical protein